MWQRFNESSRNAILLAQREATKSLNSRFVETEHLLLALVADENGNVAQILKRHGLSPKMIQDIRVGQQPSQLSPLECELISSEFKVDAEVVRQIEERLLQKLRKQELALSDQLKRVLEFAADEARETHRILQGSTEIGDEHLLLGLLRPQDSEVNRLLDYAELNLEAVSATVLEHLRSKPE